MLGLSDKSFLNELKHSNDNQELSSQMKAIIKGFLKYYVNEVMKNNYNFNSGYLDVEYQAIIFYGEDQPKKNDKIKFVINYNQPNNFIKATFIQAYANENKDNDVFSYKSNINNDIELITYKLIKYTFKKINENT